MLDWQGALEYFVTIAYEVFSRTGIGPLISLSFFLSELVNPPPAAP
jgi:hypothetical protein